MKNPNHRATALTEAENTFFSNRDNWTGGPTLDVVLSYERLDHAMRVAEHLIELLEVVCPWQNPWGEPDDVPTTNSPNGCCIIRATGLDASFGVEFHVSHPRQGHSSRGESAWIPPRFTLFIHPPQLRRACDTDEFCFNTEPTASSLRLLSYLVQFVRKAHRFCPIQYAHILNETRGFLGSSEHNPCIAVYRQFAEAAGYPIREIHRGHALIDVSAPISGG